MEEWEKEEMSAMWKFQGQCDASSLLTRTKSCGECGVAQFGHRRGAGGDDRSNGGDVSEGKARFIKKHCVDELVREMGRKMEHRQRRQ